jgi:general secretion pathway protein J
MSSFSSKPKTCKKGGADLLKNPGKSTSFHSPRIRAGQGWAKRETAKFSSDIGDPGFTLIEILIAVTILSVVLAAIYSTFFLSYKAIQGMDESMLKLQEARRAIDIMRCELDSAYHNGADVATFLKIKDRDVYGKQASQLSFTTFSTLRPGLSRVSYYIEDTDGKLNLLKRIDSPYSNKQSEGAEIIENLGAFTIEAKYNDKWVKTWDTDINKEKPDEIRISLTISIKGKNVTLSDVSKPRIDRPI